jgi:hypothetical protein
MYSMERVESTRAFTRELPGGGYVAIEVTVTTRPDGATACRGELVVERRAEVDRREGHPVPVVAEAMADDAAGVLDALFPIATSNAQVARRLMAQNAYR